VRVDARDAVTSLCRLTCEGGQASETQASGTAAKIPPDREADNELVLGPVKNKHELF
jgi:hypothetical protein